MQKFIQGIKSFVAWEWISSVTKSLFKLASYIVELPMVASGVYIMIATGISGANNPHWYNLAFGMLLGAPEVLAPGAFFRAETMEARGKTKVARVTRWIASAMLFFAALTFSSVMIFHFPDEVLQAIMFCRVMTALGYSIITRIDMDHGAMPAQPPALPTVDVQAIVDQAIAGLQTKMEQQLTEMASNQKVALTEYAEKQSHKFNLVDLQVQRLLSEVQNQPECVAPEIDYEKLARAILPSVRATLDGHVRAIWEESQGHLLAAPKPEKNGSRATSQSQQKMAPEPREPEKKPEPEQQKASANGTPEERLEAAYKLLLENSIRVSGRSLAAEAHVNRGFANKWLSDREGQSENGSGSTSEPVIEATFVVASEPVNE